MEKAPKYTNRLRYWIKKRGYKMSEVEQGTNIPVRTLRDYCAGRTAIPRERLELLATFLECSLSAIMDEGAGRFSEPVPLPPLVSQTQIVVPSPSYFATQGILTSSSLAGVDMLVKSRRQALQDMLNTACVTFTLSPYDLLPKESRQRLEMVKDRPSYLDMEALDDLGIITTTYWALAKNASIDILTGISGHFANIIQYLKDPHPDTIYQRLCSLAGQNALLLGKTFHDMKEYDLAWTHYKFAFKIAQDTQNTDLWGTSIGDMALLFLYWGEPQDALPLLREAQHAPLQNQRIRPWLSAIEAEIYALMGDKDACLRALELPRSITLLTSLDDDIYGTGFNPSRAVGFEGACFMRLHEPELALPMLEKARYLCYPTALRRQSTLLTDIGAVYAQLGDAKTACSLFLEVLDMTARIKSLSVLQRICKARGELQPWEGSAEVKYLDSRIAEMFNTLARMKENTQM